MDEIKSELLKSINSQLKDENLRLNTELDILKGVFSVMKEDLNVKNEQIDFLYTSFMSTSEHKKQQHQQIENSLKNRVHQLEDEIRVKDKNFAQVRQNLKKAERKLIQQHNATTQWSSIVPEVISHQIFSYLEYDDLSQVSQVCCLWLTIVSNDMLWKNILCLRWEEADKLCGYESIRILDPISSFCDEKNDAKPPAFSYKLAYKERHKMESNWRNGRAVVNTLSSHTGTVTCLRFDNSKLVSGSDDGSMTLWSLSPVHDDMQPIGSHPPSNLHQQHHRQKRAVQKLHSFYGHGGPVWDLYFHPQIPILISGSYDKTIKLWDLNTGNCLNTLRAHTGWVSSIDAHDDIIVSGSWDSTVKLWNLNSGELLRTLHDSPANPIYCLQLDMKTNMLVVGCRRQGVQILDMEAGIALHNYYGHGHGNQVNDLKANERNIISSGSDFTVKLWDRRNHRCSQTMLGHNGAVMCVDYDGCNSVVSGSYDRTIKLWDLRNVAHPLHSFEGHSSAVFSLQMDMTKIVSGSSDTKLKIFNFYY